MEQAIDIILSVERYRYQIFTSNFGNELYKLIGKPREYVISMTKRRIMRLFQWIKGLFPLIILLSMKIKTAQLLSARLT